MFADSLFAFSVSRASSSLFHCRRAINTVARRRKPRNTQTFLAMSSTSLPPEHNKEPFLQNVLFVECGFGNDSHGQSATKAAVRACHNAIESNSIPSVSEIVPGGYDGLKLSVILGVPQEYQDGLNLEEVKKVFPYGQVEIIVRHGGLVAPSGIAIDALGDQNGNDDMIIVCAAVTVGY